MFVLPGAEEEEDGGGSAAEAKEWVDDGSLPVDGGGALPFFFLDAHEEAASPDRLFLFGKVRALFHADCDAGPKCWVVR